MKDRLEKNLEKLFPPGYDGDGEIKRLLFSYVFAIMFSIAKFTENYYREYKRLFYDRRYMVLDPTVYTEGLEQGAVLKYSKIPAFEEIMEYNFIFLWMMMILLIIVSVQHYLYYRQGSQSILLVRRLPQRSYLWQTCLLGTLIGAGVTLATIGVLRLIYYLIYIWVTPAVCLP